MDHPAGSQHGEAAARIGPNAIIQTLRALAELEGEAVARQVSLRAGVDGVALDKMIPEAWFVRLVVALRESLPEERAEAVLRRSGGYTADYVGANRIPGFFRVLLRVLPARLGAAMLLAAFRRHAWTFAGAGAFGWSGSPLHSECVLLLDGCPTCRAEAHGEAGGAAHDSIGGMTGAYYEAAFQGLMRLAAPRASVREIDCQSRGAERCRFRLSFEPPSPQDRRDAPVAGEPRCASS